MSKTRSRSRSSPAGPESQHHRLRASVDAGAKHRGLKCGAERIWGRSRVHRSRRIKPRGRPAPVARPSRWRHASSTGYPAAKSWPDRPLRGCTIAGCRSRASPGRTSTRRRQWAALGFVAVLAQLRVDTIRENTQRGLAHARAHGRVGGRPSVMTPARVTAAVRMRSERQSIAAIARVLGVGASSVARALSKVDSEHLLALVDQQK